MVRARLVSAASRPARPAAAQAAGDATKMLALIAAAEDIFLAKGYHTATMSDVAKAAGMSKKTVYQLIDSKAGLFVTLLSHYEALFRFPVPEPHWSMETILVENLICLSRFLLSPEQIAIIRLIMAEYTHSPELGRVFHQNRFKRAKTKLETCLTDIATRQGVKFGDPADMAAMLFGMAIGEFHLRVLIGFRPAPTKVAMERRIRQAVKIFLAGTGCAGAGR